MDNYKINIKNGLDISKSTVALNELGYVLGNLPKDDIHVIYAMADKSVRYVTYDDGYDYHGIEAKDLTIDQLQELVVLNRNDVKDANHRDDDGKALFITNDNVMYYWGGEGWLKSAYNGTNAYESYLKNRVKPINEPIVREFLDPTRGYLYIALAEHEVKEKMLGHENWIAIPKGAEDYRSNNKFYKDSGVQFYSYTGEWLLSEQSGRHQILWQRTTQTSALLGSLQAFTAWLNGYEVEFLYNDQATLIDADTPLDIFLTSHGFRLKQKTIKLELEIPRPFKPQKGEKYWFMSPFDNTGYDYHTYTDDLLDKFRIQYGAYRTKEEIKQVVAAWRNSIKELNNAK